MRAGECSRSPKYGYPYLPIFDYLSVTITDWIDLRHPSSRTYQYQEAKDHRVSGHAL